MSNPDHTADNPYAPPKSSLQSAPESGCRRLGEILIVPVGRGLPERCIKCNAPAEMDKPRTFVWHHPGWYLFILVAVLAYLIVGLMVRRKATIAVGLCEQHWRRRRRLQLFAGGCLVASVASIALVLQWQQHPALGAIGLLLLLVSLALALLAGKTLTPTHIDKTEARFKGCGASFLDSLPER